MKFALLASGSKGNCCFITHGDTKIVIDCGSTKRYLTKCFQQLYVDPIQTDAILITHTHGDHVSQMKMFASIHTYATQEIDTPLLHSIAYFEQFEIKGIRITALPMSHDCEGTVGYILETENEKLVYITDTGYIKEEVKDYIKDANYYIFESNHDIEMLMQTNRPIYLKQRIINDYGHLCNDDCANVLACVMGAKTTEIVLAHISQEANTRDMAKTTLRNHLKHKQLLREDLTIYPAEQFSIYIGGKQDT